MAGYNADVGTFDDGADSADGVDDPVAASARPRDDRNVRGLRLRPPRHAGPLPRMRCDSARGERSGGMRRARRWLFNFAAAVSREQPTWAINSSWTRSHAFPLAHRSTTTARH